MLRTGLAAACAVCLFMVPVSAGSDPLVFEFDFTRETITLGSMQGFDTVKIENGHPLDDPGKPMLPSKVIRLALPGDLRITGVQLASSTTMELPGRFRIWPSQPPLRISDREGKGRFIPPDKEVYESNEAYPRASVKLLYQTDLHGQNMAVIRLCPVRYIPAEGRLLLHSRMRIEVNGIKGYECGDYLSDQISPRTRKTCERRIRDMVANPGDVCLAPWPGPRTTGVSPGSYEYVIITSGAFASAFEPLAEWKTRKGTPATIVTTSWIYTEYTAPTVEEKIKAFIQDAHAGWGAVHFLLGGDTNAVPYHMKYLLSEYIPNDTFYADFDGDYLCEVNVGRAPVRYASQIPVFIDKILAYEKAPPMIDYAKSAALLGFDLHNSGSGEGEKCKVDIGEMYIPNSWDLWEEHDSMPGSHLANVMVCLNAGYHLVNHIDHSGVDVMGMGYLNHGEAVFSADMSNLHNGARQSILYSVGCHPCDFTDHTCIAEYFVQNANGGGLAFFGNTRAGWYWPGEGDYGSQRFDRVFFEMIFSRKLERLGECFTQHKNEVDLVSESYKYIFTELTLLGDPELPLWTDDPKELSVIHSDSVAMNCHTLLGVKVKQGGGPCPDATVCLWKGSELYEVSVTDPEGLAEIPVPPLSSGSLSVTVTCTNCLPYEGAVDVVDASLFADVHEVPRNTGGAVHFTLDGGQSLAGRTYLLLGSATGVMPGTLLPGGMETLPLDWDPVTDLVFSMVNTLPFQNFLGVLDASGSAGATLNVPALPSFPDFTLYFAYCVNNPFDFVSNPISVDIVD